MWSRALVKGCYERMQTWEPCGADEAAALAGGAAGLTLTAAQAVFLMEPAINPGLEAQAAGRIHRLGGSPASQSSSSTL